MSSRRTFLGFLSMDTRRRRRSLVVVYYFFFLGFAAFLLWYRGPDKYDRLLPFAYLLAALLGGLTSSGPVRPFSRWQSDLVQGANSSADADGLDEQDVVRRDRAHYLAYAALRWPAIGAALLGLLFVPYSSTDTVAHILLFLSVPFAVLFFSLPQAILLWTEPDMDGVAEAAANW